VLQNNINQHERLLSVADVAVKLGLKEATIRGWVAQGRLASVRLVRRLLIPECEVQRLIGQNYRPAAPEHR
jgi:excisionase family DNA binding protein